VKFRIVVIAYTCGSKSVFLRAITRRCGITHRYVIEHMSVITHIFVHNVRDINIFHS
jgi:hypothetical protein